MRIALVLAMGWFALTAGTAVAGDFRIETKIYSAEDDEAPISENLTLFQTGVVYDFLSAPETITVFRPPTKTTLGRFIVLDPSRSVKMEVTTDQIERLVEKLREWAADQEDPYLRFLGDPAFAEDKTTENETLVLTSKHMTYRIRTAKPADEDSLAAYRQFSDWYARFNTRGGVVPLPFPRLVINEILFRQKAIPTMVELEIPGRGMTLRAEHRTGWLLSKQDRQRIEKVGEQISQFRSVPPEEFFHGAAEGPLQ